MPSARFVHRPLIPLTLALMLGIALGEAAPGGEAAAWAAAGVAGLTLLRALRRPEGGLYPPLLLFCAIGYLAIQPWAAPVFSPAHVSHDAGRGVLRVEGVVDGRPLEFEDRRRFVVRVKRIADAAGERAAAGLLRVVVYGRDIPPVGHGDRVALRGAIRRIRGFDNPYGFDAARAAAHRGLWAGVGVAARDLEVLQPGDAAGLEANLEGLRRRLAERIDRAVGGRAGAILKALVIGDRSAIDPELRQVFQRTGTGHLLAISGLHVGLVAAFAYRLFRGLLGRIPAVLRAAWARKGALLLAFFPVLFYALLAGFSPSTQRAFLLVAVALAAALAEREADPLNALAAAALAILAVAPTALFSISFQLSFAAAAAILWGIGVRRRKAAGGREPAAGIVARLRRGALLFLAITLLATWATAPLVLYRFNTLPLVGLPANALAVPVIGWGAVILGLGGALLSPLGGWPADLLLAAAGGLVRAGLAFLDGLSAIPAAALYTVTPSEVELVLYYALSGALLVAWAERRRDYPGGEAERRVRLRRCGLVALAALAGWVVDAGWWAWQRFGRAELRVTVLDVGAGSAVLAEFPGGKTALIDGGGVSDPSAFDVGGRVVAPVLWGKKIATVDFLVLSHPDSDHLNGLVFIARHFRVGALWVNGEESPLATHAALLAAARERGIPVRGPGDLPERLAIGEAALEVLHPPPSGPAAGAGSRRRGDPNDRSLVLRLDAGGASILLPGDIRRAAERELVLRHGGRLRSTVLLSPHHGSRGSNSEEFLDAVAPEAVIVSCAGGRGSPHPEVLERFARRGIAVWRTDRDGAVVVELGPRGHAVRPWRAREPRGEDEGGDEPE